MKFISRRFKWKISNVSEERLNCPNFRLESQEFRFRFGENMTVWTIGLEKSIFSYEPHLILFLSKKKVESEKESFLVWVQFKIYAPGCSPGYRAPYITHHVQGISTERSDWACSGVSVKNFLRNTRDGCYHIPFKIILSSRSTEAHPIHRVSEYKATLYTQGLFTDFTLESSDEKKFQVHRSYLAETSSFFMALFTTDMKEKIEGEVKFQDIDSTTLTEVLNYIYKGKAEIADQERATSILYAAEKFNIVGLKALCTNFLIRKVSVENFLELLTTADKFNCKELEQKCLKIAAENFTTIMGRSSEWKELNQELFMKLLNAYDDYKNLKSVVLIETSMINVMQFEGE